MIKAYAVGGKGGSAGYTKAVARQLAKETGTSARAAGKVVRGNAAGRTPFAPTRGRKAAGANVRRAAQRALGVK